MAFPFPQFLIKHLYLLGTFILSNVQCSTWSFYGFEAFEFLAIGILAIFLIVKGLKKFCGKGGYLEKRRESKLKRDAAKFEKLRIRFENTVEKDKVDLKGHVTDNCKEPV